MVHRRRAEPRLEPVALPLPAGGLPLRAAPAESARRDRRSPEYEILDTGVFDQDRYWVTEVTYAKSDDAAELLIEIRVTNAGHDAEHAARAADRVVPQHVVLGRLRSRQARAEAERTNRAPSTSTTRSSAARAPRGHRVGRDRPQAAVLRERDQHTRLFNCASVTPYPKDGINDHVVSGAADGEPRAGGHQVRVWYTLTVEPDGTAIIRLRLRPDGRTSNRSGDFDLLFDQRKAEADEFYRALTPPPRALTRRGSCARRSPGCSGQAVLPLQRGDLAGRRPGAAGAAAGPPAERNGRWRNFSPSTSCRCRTSGSTRGSRPGTWLSTA